MTGPDLDLLNADRLGGALAQLKARQDRLVVEDQMGRVQSAFVTIYELGGMMAVHEAYGRALAEVMHKYPKAAALAGGVGA